MAAKNKGFKMFMKATAISIALATSSMAFADQPCADPIRDQIQANAAATQQYRQNMLQATVNGMMQYQPPKVMAGNCLDTLMNMSLALQMGLPSWDAIMQGLINMALQAACKMVMTPVNSVLGPLNQTLSIPGIPGVPGSAMGFGVTTNGGANGGGIMVNGQNAGGFSNMGQSMANAAYMSTQQFQQAQNNAAASLSSIGNSAAGVVNKVSGVTTNQESTSVIESGRNILKNVF